MCQIRVNLRRWACLLAALACLLALLPLPAHAAGAASKVVRVGWYEDAYNITGKNGERSGYAYEYEQSVAAYTGWTYEYVKAGWSDLLQMMKSGEIDLMAGVSYTEDRAQDMLFSELPMGREIYYLYADLTHTDISASDLRTLNGKRIALLKTSVQAAQFYQWEEDHGLHLQYVWSNSFEQGKQQAQGREIDCVISTETPAWVEYGMSAIAQTGGSDIYFAISRTRQDLKEELDHAMRKMEFDKPFYADELYQRYLSASYTPVLSSEEQDWVTQHGNIRIGFLTSDAGISTYVPESGQLVGVINDYITFASDSISNQKLDFSLVGYDSMEEEIQALKDGQIDLIFHFAQNPYVAEENNFVLSNTVLTLNMAAVTVQNSFNENHANTVALLKDDLLLKWYVSYCYPDWNIVEYNSLKDAEAAMRSGENDCLLAESGEVVKYREDKRLHSVFLTQDGNVSFAVARGDVTLMSILNKTLRTIPASMLTGALPMYEASLEKVTVTDFVKDNFLVASVMLITFFGMILAVILVSLRRSRIAEANAKEAARQARKLNQKLQESQRELRAALQQGAQRHDERKIHDVRADDVAHRQGRLLFADGGDGRHELRQRGADGDHGRADDGIRHAEHLRERGAVVDQQLRAEDDGRSAKHKLADIERDRPAVRLGAGILLRGLKRLLTPRGNEALGNKAHKTGKDHNALDDGQLPVAREAKQNRDRRERHMIRPVLAVTEPTALPMAMSALPSSAEKTDTSISGMVVAKLTTVAPMMNLGIPEASAIHVAASTKKSPPLMMHTRPAANSSRTRKRVLPVKSRFITHSPS